MINELRLKNVRNIARATLHFERPRIVLSGANGAGKSNLLEAIGFLGLLRSFRTVKIHEMIRRGEPLMALQAVVGATTAAVTYRSDNRRLLTLNGGAVASGRDFIQYFTPVIFAPEDMMLVTGSAGGRRRFFDMAISLVDGGYLKTLHDYLQALKQRNAALRRNAPGAVFDAYETMLADTAAVIVAKRRDFLARFNSELTELSGDAPCEIEYAPLFDGDAAAWRAEYARLRPRELEKRLTLTGAHLDEFLIRRDRRLMRGFASNGQCRLAALQLKLAELNILRHTPDAAGKPVIVLVDDVTGELDAVNRAAFFRTVSGADQLFFTFTAPPADDFFADAQFFDVNDGAIEHHG